MSAMQTFYARIQFSYPRRDAWLGQWIEQIIAHKGPFNARVVTSVRLLYPGSRYRLQSNF